jgi:hypothetical protein
LNCREDHAGSVARTHEHVPRLRRTLHEVPPLERPLLSLDDQQRLAGEHEEVLLLRFPVVQGREEPLAAPRRELERTLVRHAVVHRLAVRNDDVLEGELEQRTEGRQCPLFVPRRRPDAQFAAGRGERIREHERLLLGKPQRGLGPAQKRLGPNDLAP